MTQRRPSRMTTTPRSTLGGPGRAEARPPRRAEARPAPSRLRAAADQQYDNVVDLARETVEGRERCPSGINAQPAARRSAETASSSRTRAETAPRAPVTEARALTGGRPLPPSTRERLEAAFAVPLDDVRVHTDAEATDLTDEHDAEALTIGSHIAFGPGRFRPDSEEGRACSRTKLTHVVQQGGGDGPALGRGPGSEPSEPVEREADRAAERIVRGETAEVTPGAAALTTRARIMRKARAGAEAS